MDYLGLGGRLYIGYPKHPTLSVHQLVEGEYELQRFKEGDLIESPTFAQLNLTSEQVFRAER